MLHEYGRDKFAGTILGIYSVPATLYIALLTAFPASASSTGSDLTEATTRKPINTGTSDWQVSGFAIVNKNELRWSLAGSTWNPVVGYAICTASTAGNVYYSAPFDAARQVFTGGQFIIPAGGLTLTSAD